KSARSFADTFLTGAGPGPGSGADNVPSDRPFAGLGDGIEALVGSVVSVSILSLTGAPALQITAEAQNQAKAEAIAGLLNTFVEGRTGLSVESAGTSVTVTSDGYVQGAGRLSDQALYRQAMAGAIGTSTVAVYVDVQRLATGARLSATQAANLKPVKAIGM